IRRFGIGYADDTWDSLRNYLRTKGFHDEDMIEAGVCTAGKNNGSYDFFRERAVFPVIDVRGNVVAFSGRTLGDDSRKYLNTRDTAVFKKSRTLFALNIAKNTKTRQIIIAEGQMDVIALHAAGLDNAVAGLGTALTDEHARMISQYADEVLLAYDSDEAGQKAVRRTTEVFKSTNLAVRVISMTGAKDPDEFIQKFGAERFREIVEKSSNSTEYELFRAKKNFDLETDAGRAGYMKAASEILARLDSLTERDVYAGRVAKETDGTKEYILIEAERVRKIKRAKETKQQDARLARSVSERYNVRSAKDVKLGAVSAERRIVALLFFNPDLCEKVASRLVPEDFVSAETAEIYRQLTEAIGREEFSGMPSMSAFLTSEQISLLSGIIAEASGVNFAVDDADLYIDKILEAANGPDKDTLGKMDAEEIKKLIDKTKGKML
ncbi:MAG: DNA primase, partial [Ruminococcaceae bacterium]|nr:DNA primase [Oscillospiraceae bacterium]